VSKFTNAERQLVRSIVANLTIKRIPDPEIIKEVFNQTNKTLSRTGLYYVRQSIKQESYKWYKTMREGEYDYIHEFKEPVNEIMDLQKRHYDIVDSPTVPIPIKQNSLAELHRLNITLSNLYDVAPSIVNGITVSTTPETKTIPTTRELITV
jgi:alpha-galactosidase/6-phospho-beta-glucosidase family protein